MKGQYIYNFILLLVTVIIMIYFSTTRQAEETIIFFPIDPTLHFEDAATHVTAKTVNNKTYQVQWQTRSTLAEPAYLRQDVSLLYKNGNLIGILNKWKQHEQTIIQKDKQKERDSARYDAVTFHYAEVHPNKDTFTSVQQMSQAKLYAITTPSFETFQRPVSAEQQQWQSVLDNNLNARLASRLNKSLTYFHIDKSQYETISLIELPTKANHIFRTFPSAKREEIIGKLWEGIYKHYILGIKTEDGTVLPVAGSSIPQILVAKDQSELLVLFTLQDGTPFMLRQQL